MVLCLCRRVSLLLKRCELECLWVKHTLPIIYFETVQLESGEEEGREIKESSKS